MRWLALVVCGLMACRGTPAPTPPKAPEPEQPAPEQRAEQPLPDAAGPTAAAPAPASDQPAPWWQDAVAYEIFVRSFQDSDGDGIGDLQGIIDRLDYLNDGDPETDTDLGIDLIWLMPIHPSPSYHGYDVSDYLAVNPEYGTLETFDALVAAAKRRGIRIIIDLLLNHSSDRHPWFRASRDPKSDKRSYYSWRETPPGGWARPWDGASVWHQLGDQYYYGLFWGGMPDLNLQNPAVEREMHDIMRFWLRRGVAGFRVDAIRYLLEDDAGNLADLPETHAFIKRMRAMLDREFPEALLVGEAWTGVDEQAAYYGGGDELHEAFSFDMAARILEATQDGVRSSLNQILDRSQEVIKDRSFEAPFLTNHDMPRVARQLAWSQPRLRVAAALLLASPGTPFIYYGEEIAMAGGDGREDEYKRTPMRWSTGLNAGFSSATPWWPLPEDKPGTDVAHQSDDPASLLSLYRRLIRLRQAHVALRRGDQTRLPVKGGRGVVAFVRAAQGERVLVVVNLYHKPSEPFDAPVSGKPKLLLDEGLEAPPQQHGEAITIPALAPHSFAFIALE